MVTLFGRILTRRQVAERCGALSQFAGVRLMTLGDGLERGIRMLEFRTGSGLRFTVLIDRAFDIADCDFKGQAIGWHSPSGFRHPALHEYEGERGLAWTRSFSGLVLTCGLDHILGPEETAADTCGRKARCARPPSVGALLAGSVGLARTTMQESPDFERQLASGTVPKRPLLDALTKFRLGILRAFAISGLGSITYYVGITYVPAFLVSVGKLNENESLRLSTAAAIAVIVVTPFAGILSDRLGRKPVLISLCALSAVLPVSLFYWMATGSPSYALIGALILAGVAGGVSAVGAITTAEQFPGEGRISGLALGATTATAIFGGLTPYVAQVLTERTGSAIVPGAMIAVVAVLVLPVLATLPETAPRK